MGWTPMRVLWIFHDKIHVNKFSNVASDLFQKPPRQTYFVFRVSDGLSDFFGVSGLINYFTQWYLPQYRQNATGNFLVRMYSNNSIPTTTRPTESKSTTLIGNIYIIMIDNISQYSTFIVMSAEEDKDLYSYTPVIIFNDIGLFNDLVSCANWKNMYDYNDTRLVFFTAIRSILMKLYHTDHDISIASRNYISETNVSHISYIMLTCIISLP